MGGGGGACVGVIYGESGSEVEGCLFCWVVVETPRTIAYGREGTFTAGFGGGEIGVGVG